MPVELGVRVGEQVPHAVDRLGGPDPRHDVLALRVDQELAVQATLSRRRVAGEAHSRPRGVALVPEDHLDDVDGRAEVVGDVVRAPIDLGTGRLPGVEDRASRPVELLTGVRGERGAGLTLVELRERRDQALQILGRQLDVELRPAALLQRLELGLEHVGVDPVDHLAVHLDQPPVRVVGEPRVPRRRGESLHGAVVQAEVEDRVHHPGHRDCRAGADRDEQRVGRVSEALPRLLLEPRDVVVHLGPERLGHLARRHRRPTGVGGDREARRNGNPEGGHLREPDAFPAEELPPARSLLVECVDQAHGADPTYSRE